MEHRLLGYIVNSIWMVPLVTFAVCAILRWTKLTAETQYRFWVGSLFVCVVWPLNSVVGLSRSLPGTAESRVLVQARSEGLETETPQLVGSIERQMMLSVVESRCLEGLWLAAICVGAVRLLRAHRRTRSLIASSEGLVLSGELDAFLRKKTSGRRRPTLLICRMLSTPVVVGAVQPKILVPHGFLAMSDEEWQAALLHELAHIRRWDYLTNLVCAVGSLPLQFHPCRTFIMNKIAASRELACDGVASRQMPSKTEYARCLLRLADRALHAKVVIQNTAALGLLGELGMEERVMSILRSEGDEKRTIQHRRVMFALSSFAFVLVCAGRFHIMPVLARAEVARAPQRVGSSVPRVEALSPSAAQTSHAGLVDAQEKKGDTKRMSGVTADRRDAVLERGKTGYIHRWIGSDGKSYSVITDSPADLSREQEAHLEEVIPRARRVADEATRKMADPAYAQGLAEAQRQWGSPEARARLQQQIAVLRQPEVQRALTHARELLRSGELGRELEGAGKAMTGPGEPGDTKTHTDTQTRTHTDTHTQTHNPNDR